MRLAYQLPGQPAHFIIASSEFDGTAQELWEFNVERHPELANIAYIEVGEEDYPLINKESKNSLRQKPYRAAWKIVGEKVIPDLEAARQIHLINIRRIREAKLAALDKEYIVAARNGTSTEKLELQRKELLDATEVAKNTAINSQESLYALWPTVLERRNA